MRIQEAGVQRRPPLYICRRGAAVHGTAMSEGGGGVGAGGEVEEKLKCHVRLDSPSHSRSSKASRSEWSATMLRPRRDRTPFSV